MVKKEALWLFTNTIVLAAGFCLAEQLAINELIGSSHKVMELASEHLVLKISKLRKVFFMIFQIWWENNCQSATTVATVCTQ